jgi:HEAT repeat protein
MRQPLLIGLAILVGVGCVGCGKSPPTLAGGKPVSYWLDALHAPDAKVRKKAAFKLGNVGSADPAALPALTAALADRDAAVRCEVILALLKFGSSARDVVPTLLVMQQRDGNAQVRQYAAKAVAKLRESK